MASPEMLGQVRFLHSFILILLTGVHGQFVGDPIFSFLYNISRTELYCGKLLVFLEDVLLNRLVLLLFISSILW